MFWSHRCQGWVPRPRRYQSVAIYRVGKLRFTKPLVGTHKDCCTIVQDASDVVGCLGCLFTGAL